MQQGEDGPEQGTQQASAPGGRQRSLASVGARRGLVLLVVLATIATAAGLAIWTGSKGASWQGFIVGKGTQQVPGGQSESGPLSQLREPVAVKECKLLRPAELDLITGPGYGILGSDAGPVDEDSESDRWWASCMYGKEDMPPGQGDLIVRVTSHVELEDAEALLVDCVTAGRGTIERMKNVGDDAWYAVYGPSEKCGAAADSMFPYTQVIKVQVGSSALTIEVGVASAEAANKTDLVRATRRVVPRVPGNARITHSAIGDICEHVDTGLAERAVEQSLPGHRETKTSAGEISCHFNGPAGAYVHVEIWKGTNPRAWQALQYYEEGIRLEGLGKKAYFYAGEGDGGSNAFIVLGNRMLEVRMTCPCAVGGKAPAGPTSAQRLFLRSLVKSFEGTPG